MPCALNAANEAAVSCSQGNRPQIAAIAAVMRRTR